MEDRFHCYHYFKTIHVRQNSFLCSHPCVQGLPSPYLLSPSRPRIWLASLSKERVEAPLPLSWGSFWVPKATPFLCSSGCLSLPVNPTLLLSALLSDPQVQGLGASHRLCPPSFPGPLHLGNSVGCGPESPPSMILAQRWNGWVQHRGFPCLPQTSQSAVGGGSENPTGIWLQPQQSGFQDGGRRERGAICPRPSSPSQPLHCVNTILNQPNTHTPSAFSQPNHTQVTQISRLEPL